MGSGVSSGALGWNLGHRAEIGLTGLGSGALGWDLGYGCDIGVTGVGSGAQGWDLERWGQLKHGSRGSLLPYLP